MNTLLPTMIELEKLPLRAVVAYAARTASRLSLELRGIVADAILDHALRLVEAVSTTDCISEINQASVIAAAERVAAAYADLPTSVKSPERFRIVFSLTHAALAAMYTIEAGLNPDNARHQQKLAAQEAQRAARVIEVLDSGTACVLTEAARQDYDLLLREYGAQDDVRIGDPVDCFDNT